jgi:CRP/FNR family transcriptional regulator/CRP/FNR family nitrogen fixation transcriptional regulator
MQSSSAIAAARSRVSPPPPATCGPGASDIGLIGLAVHFSRDQEIYGEGERADEVYKVVHGAVRSFRVLCDGRRQICDFYLPGDLFGVEAGVERRSSAEALTDSMIVVARRSALADEFDGGASARRLWAMAIGDLQRSQDHVLTLGRRAASERVASFLVELAARLGDCDGLELPMSRQDIADFLGLTTETVSRTFTQLEGAGLIKVTGCRSIRLCRPRALEALCE